MEHNMDALLQSDEFRDKLRRIPPHLKGVFVRAVEDLYDRESEKMLQLIWESRQEMRETFMTMEDEQNNLRSQSRMLEEKRRDSEKNDAYIRGRKSRTGRTSSRMSTSSDITAARGSSDAVDEYFRRRKMGGRHPEDPNDLQLPEASGARATSAGNAHRPAPTPVFVKSIEELRDELFKHLSTAETKVESERERQRELLEWLKEEKRNKQQEKVEKANELLEEVTQMERVKAKDKERQEQRFKEKLEEKKKLKEGKERGLTPVESVPLETAIQIEPDHLTYDDDETKERKEKRKKKKHRHRDDEENHIGEDENDEEKKERKERKKKHRYRDEDGEAKVEIEDEEKKERRKEKKKHRHRQEEDETKEEGHDDDADETKKERKREKKKHRHRRESEDGKENGRADGDEDDKKERKKEKKKTKKEKERRKEDDDIDK